MTVKPHGQLGFTLVEMLVVLALIGLAAAISLPYALEAGHAQKLDATASKVASLFQMAQSQAYITNAIVTVQFDRSTRTWTASNSVQPFQLDSAIAIVASTIEGEVTAKKIGYRFFPEGGNSGGHIILSWADDHVEIGLNWVTGAVTWKRSKVLQ
jgi:general secretion pathway protein H